MKIFPDSARIDEAIRAEIAPYSISDPSTKKKIDDILKCITLNGEQVVKIGDVFLDEMKKGLKDEPSSLLMENTYIPELPDGREEGEYLALDLGGTNFRVIYARIHKGKIQSENVKQYHVSDELRLGPGEKLFDFFAECVSDFVHWLGIEDKTLPLGFTFSFPMHQRALDIGILMNWTKSFAASNVVKQDVVKMLSDAMERRGDNHVTTVAILNDTTGTLMQGASIDPKCAIGLILGTGSNACYLERADQVYHWESERHGEKEIIIDIEWGAFGDNGVIDFIKTKFDEEVDRTSLFRNSFTFEKYISGKYLGETVRVILCHLAEMNLIFQGKLSKKMKAPQSFPTSYVSHIESDTIDKTVTETEKVLTELNMEFTNDDIAVVKYVCEIVSLRAALLISICLSELLKRMKRPEVTVAVDGSLFKHHPRFRTWMEHFVSFLAPGHNFKLTLVQDGSGKGAAITAAIALKLRRRSYTI